MSDELTEILERANRTIDSYRDRAEVAESELSDARAALGEAWLSGGEPLTQGIARLNRAYDLSYAIRKQLIEELAVRQPNTKGGET